jgi:hypothetical protein
MNLDLNYLQCVKPQTIEVVTCVPRSPIEWGVFAGAKLEIPADPQQPVRLRLVGARRVGTYKLRKNESPTPIEWARQHASDALRAFMMPDKAQLAEWTAARAVEAALGPMVKFTDLTVGDHLVTCALEPADAPHGQYLFYRNARLHLDGDADPVWSLDLESAEEAGTATFTGDTPDEIAADRDLLVRKLRELATKEQPGFLAPTPADVAAWKRAHAAEQERLEQTERSLRKREGDDWHSSYPRNQRLPEGDGEDDGEERFDPRDTVRMEELAIPGTEQVRTERGMSIKSFRLDPAKVRAINLKAPYDPRHHRLQVLPPELEAEFQRVGSQDDVKDPLVLCKLFLPDFSWTWYAIAYYPEDEVFFGYVDGEFAELGDFSLQELMETPGPMGLRIERDIHFKPQPLSAIRAQVERAHGH